MGSIVSYLFSSNQEQTDDDDDGVTVRSLLLQLPRSSEEQQPERWDVILRRIQNHPEEAAVFCHTQESSPLSIAAALNPPTRIIRSLLEAYDDAAYYTDEYDNTALLCSLISSQTSEADGNNPVDTNTLLILGANPQAASVPKKASGRLPLHYARSVSVASALVREHPAGATARDVLGRIPLHWSVDPDGKRGDTSPALVEYLVQESKKRGVHSAEEVKEGKCSVSGKAGCTCGGVLLADESGKTPLDVLCDRIVDTYQHDEQDGRLLPLTAEGERQWESLVVLITNGATAESKERFSMVHKVVELGLPPPVVAHGLRTNPTHAIVRDALGRTPLMIAASSIRRSNSAGVVHALLNESGHGNAKAARITDKEGRLPIDAAGEMGHDERVCELLAKAEPRAVDTRDLRDRMFPFMTAAIGERSDLTAVYRLLRRTPHVMVYFTEGWKKSDSVS